MSFKDDFSNLSPTIKASGLVVLGALIAAGGRFGGGVAVVVIGCGLTALGLALLAMAQIVKYLDARRSARFSKGLQRDVSDKFRQGWQRLAKAGKDKDPYFLPWYIMVGEPGAGKTQAIKHSNIKFVPGFNDPATGEGGTLAMDWWFADKAILLDTAGALLMDTARTEDFQEFLHRIRQHRPLLPINGLILAIPANALQTDTKAEIQSKATTIAQQLDLVQRELGVRFPVYVIITKADLISGFREYFDNINDPTMPTQILGWSNPAGLDGAFDPSEVEKHLELVAASLRRRRLALLLDPSGDEEATKRIDKTDALYAFPEQLAQTGMRLRTYLEHVFMPSEWTQAPLFLRGIYFTSSMREGPPLDLDLAQSFNISPRDLPAEVRVWEREKSCFLRDLFVEKIFREKGLVTASKQVETRVRMRQSLVLGVGLTALLAVVAFTIFGYVQLQNSVGGEYEFWTAATRYHSPHPVASGMLDWAGQRPDTSLDDVGIKYKDATQLASLYKDNQELAKKPLSTPAIFFFAQAFSGDMDKTHVSAHRALFDHSASRGAWGWLMHQRPSGNDELNAWPWIDPAARKSAPGDLNWDKADSAAVPVLAQLILMDLSGASREASNETEVARYAQVLKAAGWPSDPESAKLYRDTWHWFANTTSSKPDPTISKWAGDCVSQMIGYYTAVQKEAIGQRKDLLAAVQEYNKSENDFIAAAKAASDSDGIQRIWSGPEINRLIASGNKVTAALQMLSQLPGESGVSFGDLYVVGGATAGRDAMKQLAEAIQPCADAGGMVADLNATSTTLDQQLNSPKANADVLKLPGWRENILDGGKIGDWPFAQRLAAYTKTRDAWAGVKSHTDSLSADLNRAANLLAAVNLGAADSNGVSDLCTKAMGMAAHQWASFLWDQALASDLADLNISSSSAGKPLDLPEFAKLDHLPPDSAKVSKTLEKVQEHQKLWAASLVAPSDPDALKQRLDKNVAQMNEKFIPDYVRSWNQALAMHISVPPEIKQQDLGLIELRLKDLGETARAALSIPGIPANPALQSITDGQAAASDLNQKGNRMLSDWMDFYIGKTTDRPHELSVFSQYQPPNYVASYWNEVARRISAYYDLETKNPKLDVSLLDPNEPGAPAAAAADMAAFNAAYSKIEIGDGPIAAIESKPIQPINLTDGLDLRLLDSNNKQLDRAGKPQKWEVIELLSDFSSLRSSADPSVWFVSVKTDNGKTLWLRLKFASDAPNI